MATGGAQRQPAAGVAGCCGPRALWGWSPAPYPAETPWARRVDRFFPRTGLPCLLYIVAIVGLLSLAANLAVQGQLAVEGIAFLGAGAWCALNFWRCRHAHCLVSGVGWLGLSLMTFFEAGLGHSVIGGDEQLVFLAVLVIAAVFEGVWYLGNGTNAMTSGLRG